MRNREYNIPNVSAVVAVDVAVSVRCPYRQTHIHTCICTRITRIAHRLFLYVLSIRRRTKFQLIDLLCY